MKRRSTLLLLAFTLSSTLWAGTPVIDGTFDGEAVWGAPIGVGDGNPGFSLAEGNARKLYVTYDNNYAYFGAECKAQFWHQFVFALNTKDGGSSTDSWERSITWNHTNKPDFLFRGNIDNQAGRDNYAEFHVWNGTSWQGKSMNVNPGPGKTEVRGLFNESREGFIEIRVPLSLIENALKGDVQFILTGDNNDHGVFDAIPTDNVAAGWPPAQSQTSISNYVSNVALPANLGAFAGELRGSTVNLQWNTLTESNLAGFGIERSADARNWQSVGYVSAHNSSTGGSYRFSQPKAGTTVSFYRLKITDKDGSFAHSKLVMIKSETTVNAELIGNPVTSTINVAIHTPGSERIQAELVDMNGKRVSNTVYQHPGGSSVMQIPVQNIGFGTYLLRLNGSETKETMRVVKLQR
jgi:Secretion system C-terminal sorting domain